MKNYANVDWSYKLLVDGTTLVERNGSTTSSYFPICLKAEKEILFPTPNVISEKDNLPYLSETLKSEESAPIVHLKNSNQEEIPIPSNYKIMLYSGTYTIKYVYKTYENRPSGRNDYTVEYTFNFSTAVNKYPIKLLTITDCINRVLDLAEPIYEGATPRFKLNPEQAVLFDKILAPEFTMTQCTLREQLKIIGGFIQAEPRLDENNLIWFDDYGGNVLSDISGKEYVSAGVSQDINQYCTAVDTSAQNLVNVLDYAQGVVVEPDDRNYVSLRTDNVNVRIKDGDGIAATLSPIYAVKKVMCGLFNQDSDTYAVNPVEITPYIFEQHEYFANLSSYGGVYPYSKAYAIYYTQGEKGLKGLFFKEENPLSPMFEQYAIVNILQAVTGRDINGLFKTIPYPLLVFQIAYQPIYNTRFTHGKQYLASRRKKRTIVYNQSENLIETKYYGENIKGVAARLGNVEMQKTYIFPKLSDVPKVGELFDEDYYISAVSVSFMPRYVKATIALSKDFNRLSEYVGISSNKRVYEVSEKQAYARNRVFTEYVVIGDSEPTDNESCLGMKAMTAIRDVFLQEWNLKPITSVTAWGGTKKYPVVMPAENIDDYVSYEVITSGNNRNPAQLRFTSTLPQAVTINGTAVIGSTQNVAVNFTFTGTYTWDSPVLGVFHGITYTATAEGLDGDKPPLPCVKLPVISSAMGNVMTFSWNYKDNYSAGTQSVEIESGQATGFWQTDYAYGDYYGRMYYYNFDMDVGQSLTEEAQKRRALAFPAGTMPKQSNMWFSTLEHKPYLIRKDSREILQINAQIEFVTNRKDLIIGSALASSCAMVRGSDTELKPLLYVFPERLNKFINHVEGKMNVDLEQMTGVEVMASTPTASRFTLTSAAFPTNGKSWAIITKQTKKTETVEDEDGNVATQTVYKGGDVLLACNTDVVAGQTIGNIAFTARHKLFD